MYASTEEVWIHRSFIWPSIYQAGFKVTLHRGSSGLSVWFLNIGRYSYMLHIYHATFIKYSVILNTVGVSQSFPKWNTHDSIPTQYTHKPGRPGNIVTSSHNINTISLSNHSSGCLFSCRRLICVCVCVCFCLWVFLTDSENSYTLSCGVPVQPGKAPQKRNATAALPTCAGMVGQAW